MPLFEQTIPINKEEIAKIVSEHWDLNLGAIIKASQNHTFLATKKSNEEKVIVRVTPDTEKKHLKRINREIAYVEYLSMHESSTLKYVCGPIKSINGVYVVVEGDLIVVCSEFARGEPLNFMLPRWMTDRDLIF